VPFWLLVLVNSGQLCSRKVNSPWRPAQNSSTTSFAYSLGLESAWEPDPADIRWLHVRKYVTSVQGADVDIRDDSSLFWPRVSAQEVRLK
jgi:hypothetical protein